MIAGNRSLPEDQHQQASREICNDRKRRSKLRRRLPHHSPVSRENADGLESKLPLTLLRHIVTHAEKLSTVSKMVLALPHILLRSP
jgi:hypothetical protein